MKQLLAFLMFFSFVSSFAQVTPEEEGFKAYRIELKNDTIDFYVRMPKDIKAKNLFIHVEGSAPLPIWYKIGNLCCGTYDIFNKDFIPKDYTYLMIAKHGFTFSGKQGEVPKNFWKKNTLDFRVNRVNEVIKYFQKNIFNPDKLLVVGTSQGCDVSAKLATINKDITHLGFFAGGGHSWLLEYILFVRKEAISGNISEIEATKKIDSLLTQFETIFDNPSPDKMWDENSYLSYVSYSEPSINNLLKLDIPIYVAIGTKDENVAVENSYVIPVEFIRQDTVKRI